jgi:G3E family GTPase
VLENSGVAEPQNIRDKFAEAVAAGHPLAARVRLDAMVTVVDAAAFVADFASRAPLAARPDLGEGGNLRPVVDLLVEQVRFCFARGGGKKETEGRKKKRKKHASLPAPPQIECADFVLLNKVDQLAPGGLESLTAIAASLNPLARIIPCERGVVDVASVFGPASVGLVAHLNVEGQHRGAVAAAGEGDGCAECAATGDARAADGHAHGHGHHHHEHAHEHTHEHTHEHAHEHEHAHAHAHAHDHAHDHAPGEACGDACPEAPAKRARQETTAATRFGIRSFVYRRRRPFHPGRLRETVLRWLPVATNAALAEGGGGGDAAPPPPEDNESPIRTVLRSKGFMWMSHSHATGEGRGVGWGGATARPLCCPANLLPAPPPPAFYWSHAGQHFEIRDEGDWWAAVPAAEWPADDDAASVIRADFDGAHGDRRQEIVFIGAGMDGGAITAALDGALLTDEEMGRYVAAFAGGASLPDGAAAP